ncbi:MAG: fatty acid desaturase [Hyphomonadaceae bacterium]|nr:fatty acid desaturase [Hyphomonadaceae bacterium]
MANAQASASLREFLKPFQRPTLWRSLLELALTVLPLIALWSAGAFAVAAGLWWLGLLISVPAALFVVRMFMIQHDCGHRAFFESPWLNDWVGRAIGVVTMTPHDCWRRTHGIHHATSGNLDRRELGAVKTVSVAEYHAMTPIQRFAYRLYRNPIILFVIGPFYVFFLQQRLPHGIMKEGWRPWVSAMGTNVVLFAFLGAVIWMGGLNFLLIVWAPSLLLAAMIGVWLFFVQHQFEETYWARNENWEMVEAAMRGSSHYDLPPVLRWLTGNIGVHHIHHVSARIPFYKLRDVLKKNPALKDVNRLGLLESIRCAGLTLWDEASQRLVSFGHYAKMKATLNSATA